jgi:hypothetical protein
MASRILQQALFSATMCVVWVALMGVYAGANIAVSNNSTYAWEQRDIIYNNITALKSQVNMTVPDNAMAPVVKQLNNLNFWYFDLSRDAVVGGMGLGINNIWLKSVAMITIYLSIAFYIFIVVVLARYKNMFLFKRKGFWRFL